MTRTGNETLVPRKMSAADYLPPSVPPLGPLKPIDDTNYCKCEDEIPRPPTTEEGQYKVRPLEYLGLHGMPSLVEMAKAVHAKKAMGSIKREATPPHLWSDVNSIMMNQGPVVLRMSKTIAKAKLESMGAIKPKTPVPGVGVLDERPQGRRNKDGFTVRTKIPKQFGKVNAYNHGILPSPVGTPHRGDVNLNLTGLAGSYPNVKPHHARGIDRVYENHFPPRPSSVTCGSSAGSSMPSAARDKSLRPSTANSSASVMSESGGRSGRKTMRRASSAQPSSIRSVEMVSQKSSVSRQSTARRSRPDLCRIPIRKAGPPSTKEATQDSFRSSSFGGSERGMSGPGDGRPESRNGPRQDQGPWGGGEWSNQHEGLEGRDSGRGGRIVARQAGAEAPPSARSSALSASPDPTERTLAQTRSQQRLERTLAENDPAVLKEMVKDATTHLRRPFSDHRTLNAMMWSRTTGGHGGLTSKTADLGVTQSTYQFPLFHDKVERHHNMKKNQYGEHMATLIAFQQSMNKG